MGLPSPPPPPKIPPQVKSVSHDLEQLRRLLQVARCLVLNPFLCLGSYGRSLVGSVLYCALEPLAASINPRNDHWTLRDSAAVLLGRICRWVGGCGVGNVGGGGWGGGGTGERAVGEFVVGGSVGGGPVEDDWWPCRG